MLIHDAVAGWNAVWRQLEPVRPFGWGAVARRDAGAGGGWGPGAPQESSSSGGWGVVQAGDHQQSSGWGRGADLDADTGSDWTSVVRQDIDVFTAWDRSICARETRLRLIYKPRPAWRDAATEQIWNRCDEFGPRFDAASELATRLYVPTPGLVDFSFGGARYVPGTSGVVFFEFNYAAPRRAVQPVDCGAVVRFTPARIRDSMRPLSWGWGAPADPGPTGIVYPDYPGPVLVIEPPQTPDILETYMIANTVTLVVLPDRTPLDATNIRIGLDIDSFAWSFSAELFGRTSLNLVKPDAGGPKTVELIINGWQWRFLIERYSGSGRYPSERYNIQGASRTQLLTEPYAQLASSSNDAPINARQAAEEQVLPHGFMLHWDSVSMGPPDWTLPAGAFSYVNQTPLQVVARLASVVGAVVRPDPASDGLTVIPRYREAAWFWSSAVVDRIVPAEIVTEWSSEWAPRPAWNSVYVSGTSHGVGVQVRRGGSAGDVEAKDVADDWMTGTEVARSRGICELSQGGNQAITTLDIPLFEKGSSAPGLVEPAMLCEVRELQEIWRGLCLGVEISVEGVGASRVRQSLRLERHYSGEN